MSNPRPLKVTKVGLPHWRQYSQKSSAIRFGPPFSHLRHLMPVNSKSPLIRAITSEIGTWNVNGMNPVPFFSICSC